ncbi:MAG: hypothetical protein UR22_C0030G0008 [Parcubacteria group bacterium GW2011_GWC2_32_10]|nr:MAG: hypothetical protein UR22_C0030G0008 [Parcubacteria group bacterium GW2011_GWC2_32_10]
MLKKLLVVLLMLIVLAGCNSGVKDPDLGVLAKDEARRNIVLLETSKDDAVLLEARNILRDSEFEFIKVIVEDRLMSPDDNVRKSGESLLVECWGGDYTTQEVKKLIYHPNSGVRVSAQRILDRLSWKTAENATDLTIKFGEKLCEVAETANSAMAKANLAASFAEVHSLTQRVQAVEMRCDKILKKDLVEVSAKVDLANKTAKEAKKSADATAQLLRQRIVELDQQLFNFRDQLALAQAHQRYETQRARLVAEGRISDKLAEFARFVDNRVGENLLSLGEIQRRIHALEVERKVVIIAETVQYDNGQWVYGCQGWVWQNGFSRRCR